MTSTSAYIPAHDDDDCPGASTGRPSSRAAPAACRSTRRCARSGATGWPTWSTAAATTRGAWPSPCSTRGRRRGPQRRRAQPGAGALRRRRRGHERGDRARAARRHLLAERQHLPRAGRDARLDRRLADDRRVDRSGRRDADGPASRNADRGSFSASSTRSPTSTGRARSGGSTARVAAARGRGLHRGLRLPVRPALVGRRPGARRVDDDLRRPARPPQPTDDSASSAVPVHRPEPGRPSRPGPVTSGQS